MSHQTPNEEQKLELLLKEEFSPLSPVSILLHVKTSASPSEDIIQGHVSEKKNRRNKSHRERIPHRTETFSLSRSGNSDVRFQKEVGAQPGFEPGTSRTRSANHTPRPLSQVVSEQLDLLLFCLSGTILLCKAYTFFYIHSSGRIIEAIKA